MMIIDRFEQDFAVVETDDGIIDVSVVYLPENAREGDVIVLTENGYVIDVEETTRRREEIKNLMKRLIKND
ncbi:MAG: DUF3006 domain-containing protein [Ruminococcus sp.]|nr:DUF3006 domain-containing protein [Ruminococcus sp.]